MVGPRFKLTLYVTPDSSGKALADLYKALSELPYNDYQLEIVDVLDQPDRAKQADVIGTPALVYHSASGPVLLKTVANTELVRKTLGI